MYGAPIWAQIQECNTRIIMRDVAKLQRHLALRVFREYRTVSHEAAAILAKIMLFGITADRRIYLRRHEILRRDGVIVKRDIEVKLEEWMVRSHGALTYKC